MRCTVGRRQVKASRPIRSRGLPDPNRLGRNLRRRSVAGLTVGVLILLAFAMADRRGLLLFAGDDWSRFHQQSFTVLRAIDGDTLLLDAPDGRSSTTRVRLWGLDCPEIAKPESNRPAEAFADEAHAFTTARCAGKTVRLQLQRHQIRDKYNRIVAYIHLPDGSILNEELLLAGLATADDRFSHEHHERYLMLQAQAKYDRNGIWTR